MINNVLYGDEGELYVSLSHWGLFPVITKDNPFMCEVE